MAAAHDGDFVARRLRDGEVGAAADLCQFDDIDANVISRELRTAADYCWMGLYSPDGTLAALHRGMRWHRYLHLKGLFVGPTFRESGAGLRAAFAIRDWARQEGFDGITAWVERNKPESQLAYRLRVRPISPFLHRYLVRLPFARSRARVECDDARPMSGTLSVPLPAGGPPAVGELLGIEQDDPASVRVGWVLDRSRLVLSGNPGGSVAELDVLMNATAGLAGVTGATALEVPFEAADLHAALGLAGLGASRLSRSPVSLGIASFTDEQSPAAAHRTLPRPTSKAVS